jgi:hypothetical protein
MWKKMIVIAVFVGLVGILLVGAVNRTSARTESEGNGQGRGWRSVDSADSASADQSQDDNQYGWGRGNQGLNDEERGFSSGSYSGNEASSNGGYRQGRDEVIGDHEFIPAVEGELNDSDREALIFMREEEKLAHDVYEVMYELWGLPIFENISSSEMSHMEAVKTLLDGYGVPDPASDELGVFTNPDLQALYNELVSQGSQSLSEALRVGAAIEEIDILDLQERLAQTENADIQHVFTNLLNGSINHLRAFTSTLMNQTGETYQPQYMSLEEYQAIIGETTVRGGQGKGGGGGRGGRP